MTLNGLLAAKPPPRVTQHFFVATESYAAVHWVDDLDFLAEQIAKGSLRVVVDKVYTFDDAVQGYVRALRLHWRTWKQQQRQQYQQQQFQSIWLVVLCEVAHIHTHTHILRCQRSAPAVEITVCLVSHRY